jgi:hypothetical protein
LENVINYEPLSSCEGETKSWIPGSPLNGGSNTFSNSSLLEGFYSNSVFSKSQQSRSLNSEF